MPAADLDDPTQVPDCLRIGPCVEVWSPDVELGFATTALRFAAVREHWLNEMGIALDSDDALMAYDFGLVWSLEEMDQQVGPEVVDEALLQRAAVTRFDLLRICGEALRLWVGPGMAVVAARPDELNTIEAHRDFLVPKERDDPCQYVM